jgi:hypothetical protein
VVHTRSWLIIVVAGGGCAKQSPEESRDTQDSISIGSLTVGPAGTSGDATATDGTTGNSGDDAEPGDEGVGPKFDVGVATFCQQRDAGIYCSDNTAIECGADHELIDNTNCDPDICLEGTGCVACLDGQFTCHAEKLMSCNAAANPPAWQLVEVCDPSQGMGCDLALGACAQLQPVGTNVPTGNYFQFADFHTGASNFLSGYDVAGFEDKLYVLNYDNAVDVYQVALLDSDGDGKLEPNQHPDNVDDAGPIEERTLTYLQQIPTFGTPQLSSSELWAKDDGTIYIAGTQITENVLGVGTNLVSTAPGWAGGYFAHLGYDRVHGVWYASMESYRRVLQHDAETNSWGIAFLYPELAGDHMDGMEVVTDPETNIPYVYVSDMTSDFIGQYRMDPEEGWVQENLFTYVGTPGIVLEGMGFGPLNHFWATAGESVYEIGGGDLSEYTEPPG